LAEFNCGDDSFCRFGASSFESHRNCIFKLAIPSENPSSPKLGGRWSTHLPWDHISGTWIGRPPWQNSIAETMVFVVLEHLASKATEIAFSSWQFQAKIQVLQSLGVVGKRIFHGITFQALGSVALLGRIQLRRRWFLSFGGIQF
jgi:hypothetical protein